MYCPEHLVFKWRSVFVWMYWRDVRRETIPLRVWMNPLRYEVGAVIAGRRVTINREGQWAVRLPFAFWRRWCAAFGHKFKGHWCERCCAIAQDTTP